MSGTGNLDCKSHLMASALTGYTVDETGRFYWAFVISGGFACGAALCYAYFVGPVEPVMWGTDPLWLLRLKQWLNQFKARSVETSGEAATVVGRNHS